MTRTEEITYALNFIANYQIKSPETREVFKEVIQQLLQGTPIQILAAKEMQANMDFHGSTPAINAAHFIGKALLTSEGRKEAGLPPKIKGNKFRPQDVKQTDPIRQALVLRELGQATDEDVDYAIADHLGLDYDERTKKKFIAGVMPGVQTDLFLLGLVSGEITFAQNSPKVNTST
jgi:hypothetical protein